ncbi:MAG: hypothetical protein KC589_02045 [Nanoarchaeota archaeon]|nr:hypothetical protein [Nanoarchaeota archaeon]
MDIKFDQHFLNSPKTLILESKLADINKEDIIFEIGPGDGRLSKELLFMKPKKLISIETDENLKDKLIEIEKENPNFEWKIGNGLEEMQNFKFNKLVTNLPYSITEPLYIKILENKIPFCLLLHGITFYKIIMDPKNKWHYFVNAFYDIEAIKEIPGNTFEPPTKTMSILLILKLKKTKEKCDIFFQTLYNKKERNSQNALIYTLVDLGKTKKEAKELILKKELNDNIKNKKIINLSNEEFLEIVKIIKEIN